MSLSSSDREISELVIFKEETFWAFFYFLSSGRFAQQQKMGSHFSSIDRNEIQAMLEEERKLFFSAGTKLVDFLTFL